MELWIVLSLIFAVLQAIIVIASKYAMTNMDPVATVSYVLIGQFIVVACYNLFKGYKLNFDMLSILGGVSFGLAQLGLMLGLDKASNPGLADALLRLQVVMTTLLSVVFLGHPLSYTGIIGIAIAIVSAIMISYDPRENFDNNKEKKEATIPWYVYPALGGVFLSIKDVLGVVAVNKGTTSEMFVFSVSLFSALTLFIYNYYLTKTIEPQFKNDKNKYESLLFIVIAAICGAISQFTITTAMPLAPNAGYAKSISLLSVVFTTFYSVEVFHDSINVQKSVGILGLIIGSVIVSLFK